MLEILRVNFVVLMFVRLLGRQQWCIVRTLPYFLWYFSSKLIQLVGKPINKHRDLLKEGKEHVIISALSVAQSIGNCEMLQYCSTAF